MKLKLNQKVIIVSILVALCVIMLGLTMASALTITDVDTQDVSPGDSGNLIVTVENTLNKDIEDVSLSLDLTNTPFSSSGSSEQSIDELDEDDKDRFSFILRASSNAEAGNYNIPYTLTYKNSSSIKKGTFGMKIIASPVLDFTASLDNPIVGEKSQLTLKIVNKGLGEARFVNVKSSSSGYTILSEPQIYIGNINSDDFENAEFQIIVNEKDPILSALIEYEDLERKKFTKTINLPLTTYTNEEAINLGIRQKSNTQSIIVSILVILVIWLIYRYIAKRRRMRKSMSGVSK